MSEITFNTMNTLCHDGDNFERMWIFWTWSMFMPIHWTEGRNEYRLNMLWTTASNNSLCPIFSPNSIPIAWFAPATAAQIRNFPSPAPKSRIVRFFASSSCSIALADEEFTLPLTPITPESAPPALALRNSLKMALCESIHSILLTAKHEEISNELKSSK